jgi:hypothetical protein
MRLRYGRNGKEIWEKGDKGTDIIKARNKGEEES